MLEPCTEGEKNVTMSYQNSYTNLGVQVKIFTVKDKKYWFTFCMNFYFVEKLQFFSEHLLTPWYRVLLEKLTCLQLVKKFLAFHGTRMLITALTSVRQLSLSWASQIQSIYPHPTSWRSILILSTHLCLGLLSGLLPSCFPIKNLYTPLSLPKRATCPAHLILLDFITHTILDEEYKSFSSPLCNLLHSPVTSTLLGPNILLNTMFSNTFSFLSSRNVNDQVSHPYKTTGKITVLYILIFKVLNSNLEDKRFCTE